MNNPQLNQKKLFESFYSLPIDKCNKCGKITTFNYLEKPCCATCQKIKN